MANDGRTVKVGTSPVRGSSSGSLATICEPMSEGSPSKYGNGSSNTSSSQKLKFCRCGHGPCKILSSKKDHSLGRRFYCCPLSTGADNHGCGMFEWVTEGGGPSMKNDAVSPVDELSTNSSTNMMHSSSLYAKGYLEGAIRGLEQHTDVLKGLLAAMDKLDVKK